MKVTGKRILLVEDEALIAMAVQKQLSVLEYCVDVVSSGEQAVEFISSNTNTDLILMDINLGPGIDGTEAAARILRIADLPIIFHSGHTEPGIVKKTERIKNFGFVVKNSGIAVLDASIKMAIKLFNSNDSESSGSTDKFKTMYEKSPLPCQSLDSGGIVVEVNPAWLSILGYNRAAVIGKPFTDFLHPQSISDFAENFSALKECGFVHDSEFRIRHTSGVYREMTFEGCIVDTFNGIFRFAYCLFRDLTDLNIQKERELKYKLLFQNSSSAIAIHRMIFDEEGEPADYIFVDVNPAFELNTGLKREDIIGERVTAVIPGIENTHFIPTYGNVVKTGKSILFEDYVELLKKHYTVNAYRLDADHFVADFQDTSRLMHTETDLKNRVEDLRKTQEITHTGTWRLNIETDEVYWTDELYKMFGLDKNSPPPPYNKHMELFTPESWKLLSESLERTKRDGTPYELELETISTDGRRGWLWVRGEAKYDSGGKIIALWGASQDITERKSTEETIKRQLQEKEIILKEVHHRIKNNIASIAAILELQLSSADDAVRDALSDAVARVNSMQVLYEDLLLSTEFQFVSVKQYLDKLIENIFSLFSSDADISIEKSLSDFDITSKQAFLIGLIVNEVLTNTMKYAFPDGRKGNIKITLSISNCDATLILGDDGVGLPENFKAQNSKGFGLALVKMLTEQLGGLLSISSESGTSTEVRFKVASCG